MQLNDHYKWCLKQLELKQWEAAEGRLLWLRHQLGASDQAIADALSYALLMQGAYEQCLAVLQPVLESPKRTFWIHHKYADAKRGLHQLRDAAKHYRRAITDGSTSPLTTGNLLEVLFTLEPNEAIHELNHWNKPFSDQHIQGITSAAISVPGLEIARWLQERDLANSAVLRRLFEAHAWSLDLKSLERISVIYSNRSKARKRTEPEDQRGDNHELWMDAVGSRLKGLSVLDSQFSD
ncbi:hypothetical protein KUL97_01460 [Synechococcus sp. HK05]|uniref:hypothetical protein n=1 Tax=Synechococcus sp. HK05 TaxID=2725975 RepID=UPI001C3803CE|nr:hypothetical protein [Synechococcus sp. HK05]MBV2350369.1 hypothetical protein [Synechococcus sp. HK05]